MSNLDLYYYEKAIACVRQRPVHTGVAPEFIKAGDVFVLAQQEKDTRFRDKIKWDPGELRHTEEKANRRIAFCSERRLCRISWYKLMVDGRIYKLRVYLTLREGLDLVEGDKAGDAANPLEDEDREDEQAGGSDHVGENDMREKQSDSPPRKSNYFKTVLNTSD
ncbi:hypothetical protein LshimejAT787_1500500 [Lyophyllum shimeji]|uniref:Uncharacterized protein n=1 Tax=Lyophyllum shimeji TaxID=47721 RepID=A0A9P3PYD0_LYOSH|nr:hypothetical protein LshimejAT787_1500500 [Lyophyllum shimeji]